MDQARSAELERRVEELEAQLRSAQRRRRRRKLGMKSAIVGGAALLSLLAATVVHASIPGSDGVIHGCYAKNGGAVSVVDSGSTCAAGLNSLNWSQRGPQGPKGDKGDTGATGPAGPQGPAGTSAFVQTVEASGQSNDVGSDTTLGSITLTAGKWLLTVDAGSHRTGGSVGASRMDVACVLKDSSGGEIGHGSVISLGYDASASTSFTNVLQVPSGGATYHVVCGSAAAGALDASADYTAVQLGA